VQALADEVARKQLLGPTPHEGGCRQLPTESEWLDQYRAHPDSFDELDHRYYDAVYGEPNDRTMEGRTSDFGLLIDDALVRFSNRRESTTTTLVSSPPDIKADMNGTFKRTCPGEHCPFQRKCTTRPPVVKLHRDQLLKAAEGKWENWWFNKPLFLHSCLELVAPWKRSPSCYYFRYSNDRCVPNSLIEALEDSEGNTYYLAEVVSETRVINDYADLLSK
jgi:hypothetical protein